jgi:hypothetical protein
MYAIPILVVLPYVLIIPIGTLAIPMTEKMHSEACSRSLYVRFNIPMTETMQNVPKPAQEASMEGRRLKAEAFVQCAHTAITESQKLLLVRSPVFLILDCSFKFPYKFSMACSTLTLKPLCVSFTSFNVLRCYLLVSMLQS